MRKELETFLDAVRTYINMTHSTLSLVPGEDVARAKVYRHEPTAKQILQRLDPALADFDFDQDKYTAEANAVRGLGILDDMDEWVVRLEPEAPALSADRLHPWVWGGAGTLWQSGHYRQAVQVVATAVNAYAQTRLGRRDVSDDKLMQEAFSDQPPQPGKPRLRCPGDQSDATVQSRQRGARSFGVGCFFALRNPATHEHEEWPEHIALECLAAFSILARWISDWDLGAAE